MQRGRRTVGWAAAVLLLATATVPFQVPLAATTDAVSDAPNIVLIVTDDQRWDQLAMMPTLRRELADKGRTFTNAFAVDPWCCPSRVSLLRGQYPHTTRIYRLGGALGGFAAFRRNGGDKTTIATMLDAAGYRTGMVGKYLNGYAEADFSYVPPGWDAWRAFATTGSVPYFNYKMSVDGSTVSFGNTANDYATDVLGRYADGFIRQTPDGVPLFLYMAMGAPHVPLTPAPRHATSKACPSRTPPPSLGESDVSDKPSYVSSLPWSDKLAKSAAQKWVKSCKTLLAVDDAIGTVLTALEDTGRLGSTLLVFTSDNGYAFGEHRYFGKKVPYDESIRIPLIARYDPISAGVGSTDDRLTVNTDITATALDVAAVTPPYQLEGTSFLGAMGGDGGVGRDAVLVEHYDPPGVNGYVPTYCTVRSDTHTYVRYDAGTDRIREELYAISTDPFQLENLMHRADPPSTVRDTLLETMRDLCVPVPPGFDY